MTQIEIHPHTILLLVGPSNCGKSIFANDLSVYMGGNYVIISSDDCRREMLGMDLHKMDPMMTPVSSQAFKLLHAKVDLHSSFPVNTPLIIVDSTGLDPRFQDEIGEIAKKNNYRYECVMFDYKESGDYIKHLNENSEYADTQKEVTRAHVRKFRKKTLPNMSKMFKNKYRIKDWGQYNFLESESWQTLNRCDVRHKKFLIVADIHGCYEEFIEGLKRHNVKIDNGKIIESPYHAVITVGDFIDKGPKVRETIEFLYANKGWVWNIVGNHEHYVVNRLTGKIKPNEEADKHFDLDLYADVELFDKLVDLYHDAHPYINIRNEYIITHAPCDVNHLGKHDPKSLRAQRNFRYTHLSETEMHEQLNTFGKDRPYCGPTHIFGHISFDKIYRGTKMVGVDRGCYNGGELTFVEI